MDDSKIKRAYSSQYAQGLDDLEANRAGFIPIGQKRWLRQRWLRQHTPHLMFMVALFVALVVCLWAALRAQDGNGTLPLLVILSGIGAFSLAANLLRGWNTLHAELNSGQAAFIDGQVKTKPSEGYRLTIADLQFDVSRDMFLSFNPEDRYRLYYTPQSKVLLTAEKISDE